MKTDNSLYEKINDITLDLLDKKNEFNQDNFDITFTKIPDEVGNKIKERFPSMFDNKISVNFNRNDLTIKDQIH